MVEISQVRTPAQVRDVQALIREYAGWIFSSIEGSGQAPTFQGLEEELATLPGVYAPPTGSLLIASVDGEPAGCLALKGIDAGTGEVKRLYVRPGLRGRAIGPRLVAGIVDAARACGYARLVLDSHVSMTAAHRIYRSAGFVDVDPPDGFPEGLLTEAVFMRMDLAAEGTSPAFAGRQEG